MNAYLIDPIARTVTSVDVAEDDGERATLHSWYTHMKCAHIEDVKPINAHGDLLLLDEHGKYKDGRGFFFCRLWPNDTLIGRALWVGVTEEGEAASPACSLEYVAGHIAWLDAPLPSLSVPELAHVFPGFFILHRNRNRNRKEHDDE